jgi:hypothetical protein
MSYFSNGDGNVKVYLSRRNLLALLSKLERNVVDPGSSACTLLKTDNTHKVYPQSHPRILVVAVEDVEYYTDREPGAVHPKDLPIPGVVL